MSGAKNTNLYVAVGSTKKEQVLLAGGIQLCAFMLYALIYAVRVLTFCLLFAALLTACKCIAGVC